MDPLAPRVARRFLSFKYQPKEKKEHKVERITKALREATGLSKGVASDIADAVIRGREVERLALQKGWLLEGGKLVGPEGTMTLAELASMIGA